MDLTEAQLGQAQTLACSKTTLRRSRSALARCASRAETGFFGSCALVLLGTICRPLSTLQTCHRRFQQWQRDGTLTGSCTRSPKICGRVANSICRNVHRRQLQFGEKGGAAIGPTRRGKGSKSWRSQTAMVFLSPAASPALRRMNETRRSHHRAAFHASQTKTNDRRPRLRQ